LAARALIFAALMCISGVLPQAVTFGAPRPGAQKLKDILAPASPVLPYIWVDDIDATLALVAETKSRGGPARRRSPEPAHYP
jgi:hypothetical protein